jgi:uncharacterized membrane protein YdjX (TVP38/TMEM64 family)
VGLAGAAVVTVALLVSPIDLASPGSETLAAQVRAYGALGPVALVVLLVLQAVVAPLPAPPLLMAAGFVYGPLVGFGIGWLGLLLGASACFALARVLGRAFAERFVSPERLASLDQYVVAQSSATVLTVLSLRVFMPPFFDAVSYACGLVRVPLLWFVVATAFGEVPKVATFTYLGAMAGDAPAWLKTWILLVPVAGLIGLGIMRRALRARRPVVAERRPGSSAPSSSA